MCARFPPRQENEEEGDSSRFPHAKHLGEVMFLVGMTGNGYFPQR